MKKLLIILLTLIPFSGWTQVNNSNTIPLPHNLEQRYPRLHIIQFWSKRFSLFYKKMVLWQNMVVYQPMQHMLC